MICDVNMTTFLCASLPICSKEYCSTSSLPRPASSSPALPGTQPLRLDAYLGTLP